MSFRGGRLCTPSCARPRDWKRWSERQENVKCKKQFNETVLLHSVAPPQHAPTLPPIISMVSRPRKSYRVADIEGIDQIKIIPPGIGCDFPFILRAALSCW